LLPEHGGKILRKAKYKKYHLGCNKLLVKGWLNVDFVDKNSFVEGEFYPLAISTQADYFFLNWDLVNGLPAEKESLDYVYHSHFLEHLSYRDGLKIIGEIFSALRPRGRHRIVVPDLEKYCRSYLNDRDDFLIRYQKTLSVGQVEDYEARGALFVSQLYEHGHKMGWDFETLFTALSKAGFKNIERKEFAKGDFPDLDKLEIGDSFRIEESMVIECEK
jgi:hypothetical protein